MPETEFDYFLWAKSFTPSISDLNFKTGCSHLCWLIRDLPSRLLNTFLKSSFIQMPIDIFLGELRKKLQPVERARGVAGEGGPGLLVELGLERAFINHSS